MLHIATGSQELQSQECTALRYVPAGTISNELVITHDSCPGEAGQPPTRQPEAGTLRVAVHMGMYMYISHRDGPPRRYMPAGTMNQ